MIFLKPLSHNAKKIRFFRLFLHFLYYSSRTHARYGERFRSALADTPLRIAVHLRSTSVGSEPRSPGSYLTEANLEAVLEHEFTHIKHYDVFLKWILVLLCSLYWYNPLIWVMYLFVNRDIELSCDEALLKHHSSEYRKTYLLTLLDMEEKIRKPDIFCSSFCRYPTEERIKVMMKRKKSKIKSIFFALLISSMVLLLNMGAAAETGEPIPGLTGQTHSQARQVLQKYNFSYITEKR